MKKIVFPVLFLILTNSCIRDLICLDGAGPLTTDVRQSGEIVEIVNTTSADVIYLKADSVSISVKAASNLIRHIVTDVTNGRLEIKTDPRNTCFDRGSTPVITITSPEVHSLDMTGPGSLNADSLSGGQVRLRVTGSGDLQADFILADELKIELTGSGDASIDEAFCQNADFSVTGSGDLGISGNSESGVMRVTGSGNIRSGDMVLRNASLTITASGNINAHVTDALTAVISGSGNIYLKGRPTINQTVTGSGKIVLQ